LEEEDIPSGLWLCHACKMKEKYAKEDEEKEQEKIKLEAAANESSEPMLVEEKQSTEVIKTLSAETTVIEPAENASTDVPMMEEDAMTTTTTTTTDKIEIVDESKKDDEKVIEPAISDEVMLQISEKAEENALASQQKSDEKVEKVQQSPFEALIRAASLLNPRQFELPIEMTEQFNFPGSERAESMKNGRRVKNKRLVELDAHGCVPLPAKLCFNCNKSCKRAPLISCDYCTLYFHQDCLNPPLCALPAGKWMCPNHPQHFIDWNLVSSLSATERLKLWDQYGKSPIDHEVVKLQFFRKVHMKNPPFRIKTKPKRIDEVEIPEIVKFHYENPPELLPSLRDVMRIETLKKRGTVQLEPAKTQLNEINQQLEAIDTARKKLKNIFVDQEDIHHVLEESDKEDEEESVEKSPSPKKSRRSKAEKESEDVEMKSDEVEKVENEKEVKESNVNKSSSDENANQADAEMNKSVEIKSEIQEITENEENKEGILKALELQSINEQLCNLDMDTIKLLAFQRLQQIVNENPNCIQKFQNKDTAAQTVTEIAKWDTHRFPIPLSSNSNGSEKVDEKPVIVRMHDRPFHIRSDEEKASSVALSLEYPLHRSKVRSRAVFTFVNEYLNGKKWFTITPSLDQSVFMRYRSFDIGIGADNHLDLSRFGICANISSKHAVIFFDDVTKQFEMLNYSEFGTEVNGQLYACDFSDHPEDKLCETPTSPLKDKRVAIQSKIKNMLDAKKKIREGTKNETECDLM
jgi:hypothetical protein